MVEFTYQPLGVHEVCTWDVQGRQAHDGPEYWPVLGQRNQGPALVHSYHGHRKYRYCVVDIGPQPGSARRARAMAVSRYSLQIYRPGRAVTDHHPHGMGFHR